MPIPPFPCTQDALRPPTTQRSCLPAAPPDSPPLQLQGPLPWPLCRNHCGDCSPCEGLTAYFQSKQHNEGCGRRRRKREFSQWAEALTTSRNLENFVAPSELHSFLGGWWPPVSAPAFQGGGEGGRRRDSEQKTRVGAAERLRNPGPGLAGRQQRVSGPSEPVGGGAQWHVHAPRKGKMWP